MPVTKLEETQKYNFALWYINESLESLWVGLG